MSAPRRIAPVEQDWVAFGASVQALPETEQRDLYARTLEDFENNPGEESAIRLAILALNLDGADRDYSAVLSRLSSASDVASDDADADFIRFIEPILQTLTAQQRALETETRERKLLQEQLDALKALEEQLNAEDALR